MVELAATIVVGCFCAWAVRGLFRLLDERQADATHARRVERVRAAQARGERLSPEDLDFISDVD